MMLRIGRLFILLLLCAGGHAQTQNEAAERYLEVRGTSELDMEPLSRATVNLYQNGSKIKSVQTGTDGSFSLKLEMNNQYVIEIEKNGLISKRISFNTTMPDEEKGAWMNEFSMGLVRSCQGVDYSVLKEPVDKVSFDPKRREFVSDKDYVSRMRPRIEAMMMKNDQCLLESYEAKIKQADQLAEQKNFDQAVALYKEANEIFPTETYPDKRISEINEQINKQQSSTEGYKKIIEEADVLAAQQRYSEAIQKYKNAARLNPRETYPNQKITELEAFMAKQQSEKQALMDTEDRYNQAMAKASVAYTRKDYATAKQYYQEALNIKPAESVPRNRMQEIETILAKKAAENAAKAAEATQKAAFENEYKGLIAMADEQFKAKKYEEARQNYAKALDMKPSESYPAQRVKTIENTMAAEQAALQKSKEDGYTAAMIAANKALAQNQFPMARDNYQKALTFKPDDAAARNQLAQVDRQAEAYARQKQLDEQYAKAIQTADALLQNKENSRAKQAYVQALSYKPGDQYAQSKITAIDNLEAAEQAARIKATEEGYKAAIGAANTAIAQKSYTRAKEFLQKALSIKPGDVYATGRSAEVDRLIEEHQKIREQEQLMARQYSEAIAAADQSFNNRDYTSSKASYNKALQMKPGDAYASQKIASIDEILAAEIAGKQKKLEDSYSMAMERGTGALVTKDYNTAKGAFEEALKIKPSDASAKSKLAETELLMKQAQEKLAAEQARKKKYDEIIRTADQYMTQKNYSNARISYEEALEIMPGEVYPRQKIEEATQIMAEQERILAEKQATDHAYNLALSNADKYFRAKDYIQARDEYARALGLKPEEALPRNKMAEMENLIKLRQKEQDEAKARADAYSLAMNAGNASLAKKDYIAARNSYNEALKHMPGDALATEQVRKIDYILAEAQKLEQAGAARKASYEASIKSADAAFDAGKYAAAKEDYKKALAFEPSSVYAKQRIARIEEINRILSQSGTRPASSPAAGTKVTAAIPMGELNFRSESEKQRYLEGLKQKYPEGITLEKYKEPYKETYRYIIIRDDLAQEFRHIRFTNYNGSQYTYNGKPITQQYFVSQTKPRQGENYKEIDMQ